MNDHERRTAPPASTDARNASAKLSDHLANERTYLAWLRTSLAVMGFGIALNRLSLYLVVSRERKAEGGPFLLYVERLGLGVLLLGGAIALWAAAHYTMLGRAIERGEFRPNVAMVWVFTCCILLVAAISLVWLSQP